MPHKYVWVPTMLAVGLSLAACDQSDNRASVPSDSKAGVGTPYSDDDGMFHGGYGLEGDAGGTCADDSDLFAECSAPLKEPASPTGSKTMPADTVCAAARVGLDLASVTDASELHKATIDGRELTDATPMSARRCGVANESTNAIAENAGTTRQEISSCSCGKQLCMCA